jgi:hypothetical protein
MENYLIANPWLRVLIVDHDQYTRVKIDKILAGLGYHRIAPLNSLCELMTIIDGAMSEFDLLIINDAMLKNADSLVAQTVRDCPDIRYRLSYQDADLQQSNTVELSMQSTHFTLPGLPDRESISQAMSLIDMSTLIKAGDEHKSRLRPSTKSAAWLM